jgi:predicted acylesterase/phospholipase RssA
MTMPNVQVAFQGGGAKLVNLLAVAEVLESAHDGGEITITRVAGTSAGAIVACLLASGTGIRGAKQALQTNEMEIAAAKLSRINPILALLQTLRGRPFKSMDPIIAWLRKRLQGDSVQPVRLCVSEVSAMRKVNPMELLIVSSDLMRRGSRSAPGDDDAVQAVADSSGVPFLFRTWRGAGYRNVDGGLCSNLPVDFLLDKVHKDGEVLAISFKQLPIEEHDGLLSFLMALVDTSISAGEDKARRALPEANVYSIVTGLTTFDFGTALKDGLGEQYQRIKDETRRWLDRYLSIVSERKMIALDRDPWRDQSPSTAQVMEAVGNYFDALEATRFINYHSARLLVVANSLRTPREVVTVVRDAMEFRLEFSTCEQPIHMIGLSVSEIHPDATLDLKSLVCSINDQSGATVHATLIPMRRTATPEERRVCVCFSKPLPATSGPYKLRYELRGTNFMRDLQLKGEDQIAYYPVRANGPVGKIELIIQVPENYDAEVNERGSGRRPRRLTADELPDSTKYGLKSLGFVAEDIEKTRDLWHMIVRTGPRVD